MSQLSQNYVDKVIRWSISQVDLEKMHMTLDQQFRARLCLECYRLFTETPSIPVRRLVKNISARDYKNLVDYARLGNESAREMMTALGIRVDPETGIVSVRSETNITNDIWLVNQLVGRLNVSKNHIHRAMYEANIDWLNAHGRKTGTWQAIKEAQRDLEVINNGFKGEDDPQEQMPNTNINITGDVGVVKEGRESLSDDEREKLRKKYGLTDKELAVQMEEINGVWQEPDPEEETTDIFDENL